MASILMRCCRFLHCSNSGFVAQPVLIYTRAANSERDMGRVARDLRVLVRGASQFFMLDGGCRLGFQVNRLLCVRASSAESAQAGWCRGGSMAQ
jgi:hypothetical protein